MSASLKINHLLKWDLLLISINIYTQSPCTPYHVDHQNYQSEYIIPKFQGFHHLFQCNVSTVPSQCCTQKYLWPALLLSLFHTFNKLSVHNLELNKKWITDGSLVTLSVPQCLVPASHPDQNKQSRISKQFQSIKFLCFWRLFAGKW